jgi:hypothetical protein
MSEEIANASVLSEKKTTFKDKFFRVSICFFINCKTMNLDVHHVSALISKLKSNLFFRKMSLLRCKKI